MRRHKTRPVDGVTCVPRPKDPLGQLGEVFVPLQPPQLRREGFVPAVDAPSRIHPIDTNDLSVRIEPPGQLCRQADHGRCGLDRRREVPFGPRFRRRRRPVPTGWDHGPSGGQDAARKSGWQGRATATISEWPWQCWCWGHGKAEKSFTDTTKIHVGSRRPKPKASSIVIGYRSYVRVTQVARPIMFGLNTCWGLNTNAHLGRQRGEHHINCFTLPSVSIARTQRDRPPLPITAYVHADAR